MLYKKVQEKSHFPRNVIAIYSLRQQRRRQQITSSSCLYRCSFISLFSSRDNFLPLNNIAKVSRICVLKSLYYKPISIKFYEHRVFRSVTVLHGLVVVFLWHLNKLGWISTFHFKKKKEKNTIKKNSEYKFHVTAKKAWKVIKIIINTEAIKLILYFSKNEWSVHDQLELKKILHILSLFP